MLILWGNAMQFHNSNRQGLTGRWLVQWLLAGWTLFQGAADARETLQLDGEVGLPQVTTVLEPTQQQAVQALQVLRLGVTESGYEPLEVMRSQSVRGITADYLSIIADSLGLKVEVHVYPDWPAALMALSRGEVDVLGRGSSYEQQLPDLLLSRPYTENQPVLVGRGGDMDEQSLLTGGRMAVVDGYAPMTTLAARYPSAKLEVYATVREALHAVEYDGVRWLVCDAATVAYHLALGELPSLRMRPLSQWRPAGYGFVFRLRDGALRDAFDRVLAATPRVAQAQILEHWGVEARFDSERASTFSPEQLEWLATRPQVSVVVHGGIPPYSFFDDDGQFRGLLADLLAEIGQRSGVRFTVVEQPTLSAVLDSLRDGKGEMTAMLLPAPGRQAFLNFTEPYAKTSFALVGPRESAFKQLSELQGRRVVMLNNSAVTQYMQQHYPEIKLLLTDSYLETLMAVADGKADAAIVLLPITRYMINQYFAKDLRVITSLPHIQAPMSFAVVKDSPMLYGVMQAALNQIEPRFIGTLVERWQNSLPAESNMWSGYERKWRLFLLVGGGLLLLLLVWQGYAYVKRLRDRAEKARLAFRSALLDGIPQAVVVRDRLGRFVLCNHTFFRVFALEPDQVVGRLWEDVQGLDPAQESTQTEVLHALLDQGQAIDIREIILLIQGETVAFSQWAVPHRDGQGRTIGLLMGWVDVTATQRLLQQLQEARDQAVQASEAKSRFLAVMSHEIRTPLNAIIGLLELTMERVDRGEPWDRGAIEVAYSSSGALMLLIGDILDLAKIEAGKMTLEPGRYSPQEILESVQRVFSGLARQKGLSLGADLQIHSQHDMWIDGGRLKQVLSNLLSNAIKFTDRGGIRLSLQVQPVGADLCVQFVVRDSGIGIASRDQARLFEPFSQAQEPASHRGGTGLGLVICKQLVAMMGGQLSLHSEPGLGSQVVVEVRGAALEPLPPEATMPHLANAGGRSLNVLLVDDHPPNRLLLRQQLLFLGHRVTESQDGSQAFACFQAEAFDVVITDCNMPVMGGYELTRLIRAAEHQAGRLPCLVVGFTANAQAEERLRCLEAGMNDCLFKPVRLKKLRACLDIVMQVPRAPSEISRALALDEVVSPALSDWLDLPLLHSLTDDDELVLHMLLTELLASNKADLQRLEESFVVEHGRDLDQIVHRLKGAARMVGAQRVIDMAMAYEAAQGESRGDEELRRRARALHKAVTQLQTVVSSWLASIR